MALVTKEFGDPDLTDVTLVVGNTEFKVHKMILAFCSKYFKALFYGDFEEKHKDRIEIKEVDLPAFERMLEEAYDRCFTDTTFMKCPRANLNNNNTSADFWEQATNVWAVMDRFDVPRGMEYFRKLLTNGWCRPRDDTHHLRTYSCDFCINRYIFCKIHEFECEELEFYHGAVKSWVADYFEGVPEAVVTDGLLQEVVKKIHVA